MRESALDFGRLGSAELGVGVEIEIEVEVEVEVEVDPQWKMDPSPS